MQTKLETEKHYVVQLQDLVIMYKEAYLVCCLYYFPYTLSSFDIGFSHFKGDKIGGLVSSALHSPFSRVWNQLSLKHTKITLDEYRSANRYMGRHVCCDIGRKLMHCIILCCAGGNMFCIKIWSKNSPPYMQALHFSFAIGAFLAPLLARPFLVGESALGANSSVYPVSHIPINPKLLDLGEFVGHDQGNMHRLTRSAEVWWFTDGRHDRVLRDADEALTTSSSVTVDGVNGTAGSQNGTGNISTTLTPIQTTAGPRPTKPSVSDGKHLNTEYANGDKAMSHIMEHKDDARTDNTDGGGTQTGDVSITENSGTAGAPNVSAIGQVNNTDTSSSVEDGNDNVNQSESGLNTTELTSSGSVVTSKPSTTTTSTTTSTTTTTTTSTTTTTTTPSTTTTTTSTTTSTTTTTTPKPTSTTTAKPVVKTDAVTAHSTNSSSPNTSTVSIPTTTVPTTTTTRKHKPEFLDVITSTLDAVKHMSKIQFAYMIIGLILMGDAVFFLGLYCKDCRAGTLLHQINALGPSPPPTSSCFRVSILSLLFVFFFMYVGTEVAFGGLVTTFAVESEFIQWNRPQGATLAALFWGSIAVGRGMGIFIARCFKPPCMLVTDLVFMVAGAVILSFGLAASPALLWVGTVVLGCGMSSIFPTAVSWADCYYPLTGRAAAVFITGSGVGEMVIPVVTGYLFEQVSTLWLMYMVLGLSVMVTVVFTALQCIASRQPAPKSTSKIGFLPLHNEEEESSLAMDDMVNGSTGYTENTRRRPYTYNKTEDAEEETTKLVDISEWGAMLETSTYLEPTWDSCLLCTFPEKWYW